MNYLFALDTIRLLGFLVVFLHHLVVPVTFFSQNGWLGMDLLFCLSSFLLTSTYLQDPDTFSFGRFIRNRFFRIYPILIIYVLLLSPFPQFLPYLFQYSNWWIIFHGWSPNPYLGHLWSIALQEQFLYVWLFTLGLFRPKKLYLWILPLFLLSFFAKLLFYQSNNYLALYMNTFARFDPFLVGALLAWLWKNHQTIFQHRIFKLVVILVLALGLIPLTTLNLRQLTMLPASLGYFFIALWVGSLISFFLAYQTQANPVVSHLSKFGYGLFLWHKLAIEFSWRVSHQTIPRIFLTLLFSYLLANLSYYLVEKPILALKNK